LNEEVYLTEVLTYPEFGPQGGSLMGIVSVARACDSLPGRFLFEDDDKLSAGSRPRLAS
jgi:hypothetical protein